MAIDTGRGLTYRTDFPISGINQSSGPFRSNFAIIKGAVESLQTASSTAPSVVTVSTTVASDGQTNLTLGFPTSRGIVVPEDATAPVLGSIRFDAQTSRMVLYTSTGWATMMSIGIAGFVVPPTPESPIAGSLRYDGSLDVHSGSEWRRVYTTGAAGMVVPSEATSPDAGTIRYDDQLDVHTGSGWEKVVTEGEAGLVLPESATTPDAGSVRFTDSKLATHNGTRWNEYTPDTTISVLEFGAVGDGIADDSAAIQDCFNAAGIKGVVALIPDGIWRVTSPLNLPTDAAGLIMRGQIVYDALGGPALTIGSPDSSARARFKVYRGINIARATTGDWLDETEIGLVARNLDNCSLDIVRISGFTIGLQTLGDGPHGFEDSTIHLGQFVDNQIGLDIRTATANAWNNSVRYIGGHFTNQSDTHPTMDRFGIRLSKEDGAYDLHNAHTFVSPGFELQRQGTPGTVTAIPFLLEVSGRGLHATGIRIEACSPFVARHTAGYNDAIYEVVYIGTYGYTGGEIDYTSTATRAGGTVIPYHQSAPAIHTPRLVASADNVRNSAFRNVTVSTGGIGFERMAVMSGNASGPPSTMNGFCFPGLSLITLNSDTVTLPTSRALAFVFDTSVCKEFFIAAEGSELRPIVQQYDVTENVLTETSPVLFSSMNTLWSGTPTFWHEGNADLDSLTGGLPLNRLQRVRVHQDAAFAAIGVRGGAATSILRSIRIYTSSLHSPSLIYGGSRSWGVREITVTDTGWTVPSLAAGALTTRDVTLTGVRQGDFVDVSFAKSSGFQNGGVLFHAEIGGTGSTNQVRVTAQNTTGSPIDIGAGTLYLRAVRPRV